jgi:integrase
LHPRIGTARRQSNDFRNGGFFLLHSRGEGGTATARELFDAYLEDRRRAGRRERTIDDIRYRLGRFADDFEDTAVHEIGTAALESWLDRQNGGDVAKRNMRVHISGLFNFAVKRRHLQYNPAIALSTPKIRGDKRPQILSAPQARHLMNTARESAPDMIPYFGLCMFAGIRPTETQRLDWSDINLDRGEVFISAQIAKTVHDRYTKLQPNLIEWLLPHRKSQGIVHFSRRAFNRVRTTSGIEWANDIMRHTYGSMHLAAFRNAGDTAEQMGHQGTKMLFEHYRRATKQEDGAAFFEIRPGQRGEEKSAVSV